MNMVATTFLSKEGNYYFISTNYYFLNIRISFNNKLIIFFERISWYFLMIIKILCVSVASNQYTFPKHGALFYSRTQILNFLFILKYFHFYLCHAYMSGRKLDLKICRMHYCQIMCTLFPFYNWVNNIEDGKEKSIY